MSYLPRISTVISLLNPFSNESEILSKDLIDKKEKRYEELNNSYNSFKNNNTDNLDAYKATWKEGALSDINNYYWNDLHAVVHRHIKADKEKNKKLDRFKLIAGIELSIIKVQPWKCKDVLKGREMNAFFAFNTAFGMFNNMVLKDNHVLGQDELKAWNEKLKLKEKEEEKEEDVDVSKFSPDDLKTYRKLFLNEYGFRLYREKHLRWLMKINNGFNYNLTSSSHNWLLLYLNFCSFNNLTSNFKHTHKVKKENFTFKLLKI